MKGHATLMSKASDEWATPQEFFDVVDRFFAFGLDAAATAQNTKAECFFVAEDDSLRQSWCGYGSVWLNPPYSRIAAFMDKAATEAALGATVVCLVPARTDTQWWHRTTAKANEVRLLRGRLKFGDGASSAPFPSALVVFGRHTPHDRAPRIYNWDWRDR